MITDAILSASRHFFATHNLAAWADALPATIALSVADQAAAAKHGFTAGFAFPPFTLQMESLDRLIDETARKPAVIPDNQQYREPFLADDWSKTPNGKVLQRQDDLGGREWGAYFFLFSPNPIQKCWGLTGKQIREQFDAKDWRGLTVPEYLVLQRLLSRSIRNGAPKKFTTQSFRRRIKLRQKIMTKMAMPKFLAKVCSKLMTRSRPQAV